MFISEFQSIGQDLFVRGLISSHGGNLSLRLGDRIMITRRGAQLGRLNELDLIETGVERNDRATPTASSELAVHRAIYRKTQAQALVHAHPPCAIALSLLDPVIELTDAEGRTRLGTIPVIGDGIVEHVQDVIDEVSAALQEYKVVVVRGHGSIAAGQLLGEAYHWTSLLEESCRIVSLVRLLDGRPRSRRRAKNNHGLTGLAKAVVPPL